MKMYDLTDYKNYVMGKREKGQYTLMAAAALFALGYIFFSNVVLSLLMASGCVWYPRSKCRDLARRRRAELNSQFKDALYSLSSSLSVGRSLESAFTEALNDLRVLYSDPNTHIVKEFEGICRRIELNEPLEHAVLDFAARSGLEDVQNFADTMVTCRRTGGNLVQVVKNTATIIGEKIEISEDIELLLAKQKYEQKMLNYMPFIFIALIKFGGSGYMDPLYTSIRGYVLMAVALLILGVSYLVSSKIFDIRV